MGPSIMHVEEPSHGILIEASTVSFRVLADKDSSQEDGSATSSEFDIERKSIEFTCNDRNLKRRSDPKFNDVDSEPMIKKRRKTLPHPPATSTKKTVKSTGRNCEHGREKSKCKDCGGASICQHGREKSRCKECGGVAICQHGRQKPQCKDCGGASICQHGRQKSLCKD